MVAGVFQWTDEVVREPRLSNGTGENIETTTTTSL